MLGEQSYPPNSTETQAYHQISACRTRPDYGIISVWHWKGHSLEGIELGADEDKLTSTFVAACYGSKVEGDVTTHRYQV